MIRKVLDFLSPDETTNAQLISPLISLAHGTQWRRTSQPTYLSSAFWSLFLQSRRGSLNFLLHFQSLRYRTKVLLVHFRQLRHHCSKGSLRQPLGLTHTLWIPVSNRHDVDCLNGRQITGAVAMAQWRQISMILMHISLAAEHICITESL